MPSKWLESFGCCPFNEYLIIDVQDAPVGDTECLAKAGKPDHGSPPQSTAVLIATEESVGIIFHDAIWAETPIAFY
jgi:hypothetical protein